MKIFFNWEDSGHEKDEVDFEGHASNKVNFDTPDVIEIPRESRHKVKIEVLPDDNIYTPNPIDNSFNREKAMIQERIDILQNGDIHAASAEIINLSKQKRIVEIKEELKSLESDNNHHNEYLNSRKKADLLIEKNRLERSVSLESSFLGRATKWIYNNTVIRIFGGSHL